MNSTETVFIVPIINRSHAGDVVPELGAGGGGADFSPPEEIEIDMSDKEAVKRLVHICRTSIPSPKRQAAAIEIIRTASADGKSIRFKHENSSEDEDIKLPDVVRNLAYEMTKGSSNAGQAAAHDTLHEPLPTRIVSPLKMSRDGL